MSFRATVILFVVILVLVGLAFTGLVSGAIGVAVKIAAGCLFCLFAWALVGLGIQALARHDGGESDS